MAQTKFFLIALAGFLLAGCSHTAKSLCVESDKVCLQQALNGHQVRDIDSWEAELAKPLAQRMGPAPEAVIEYLTLDNKLNGYPERPTPATLDGELLSDVQTAINEIPAGIRRLFDEKLLGVFFLEQLGGTGYTESVRNAQGQHVAGFIVLDASVLRGLTANSWATWKESTPFKATPGYRLEAQLETPANDNRRNAIQYILLHELGHVLSIGGNFHPNWSQQPAHVAQGVYPFFDLSWSIDGTVDSYQTHFDTHFAQRKDVAYYFGAKLLSSDMVATYENLELTNFPSLYAATSPGDDFAESFASYVHVVHMQRPWQISILREGKVVKIFKACWDEPRCASKRAMLPPATWPSGAR